MKEEFGRVEILFPAVEEKRIYSMEHAPVRRVALAEGDRLVTSDDEVLVVCGVEEEEGLLIYQARGAAGEDIKSVPEALLSDKMSFTSPRDRVLAGRFDESRLFELRGEALDQNCAMQKSEVRGLQGARIDLILHQLAIAKEVTSRAHARVLLADEVGLGKTIEACLILQRLHLTGRADRVLILVPEPLVHQWFVELRRRFQINFSIFDEERCQSIEASGENPFSDSQLILAATSFVSSPVRAAQARMAGWDLLIVDEAHHLTWTPEEVSPEYELVETLAGETDGVLLLTATPQQLGPEGHFARLRLLDPERYGHLEDFFAEMTDYEHVAEVVEELLAGKLPAAGDFTKRSERVAESYGKLKDGDESAREELISRLIDTFGTGRIMFRNTRQGLTGFPERKAHLVPLTEEGAVAKVDWLVGFLKELPAREKVLVIGATKENAEELGELLRERMNVKQAVFHEGLSLIQRDRNAAYFGEEDGARVLICSEIGSEGRNFQFAHHLVLLDLPPEPDLVEQRIGRLDRIGQTETIKIHVPYAKGTSEEVLVRWYHEALDAFQEHLKGGTELAEEVAEDLKKALSSGEIGDLLEKSSKLRAEIGKRLERGHDRLLELSLPPKEEAEALRDAIEVADNDGGFEEFFIQLLDNFGFKVEDMNARGYLLGMGEMSVDVLPDLPEEGMAVTFDRARALSREDLTFMSRDHPIVLGVLDQMLSADTGNAAFGVWEVPGEKAILLEAHYVMECLAPAELHVDRFLPSTPLWCAVDHSMRLLPSNSPLRKAALRGGKFRKLIANPKVRNELLPAMFTKLEEAAVADATKRKAQALAGAKKELTEERSRLVAMAEANDTISPRELAAQEARMDATLAALGQARVRLDSARMIWREAR